MWTTGLFLLCWDTTESTIKVRRQRLHPSFSPSPYNSSARQFSSLCPLNQERKHPMIFFSKVFWNTRMDQFKYIISADWDSCGAPKFATWGPFYLKDKVCTGKQLCFKVSTSESFHSSVAPTRALQTGAAEEAAETFLHGLLCPAHRPAPVLELMLHWGEDVAATPLLTKNYFLLSNTIP